MKANAEDAIYFQFERDFVDKGIRCIPMIVRYKLDACGIKLKLATWNRMTASEREGLALAGCETAADIRTYKGKLCELIARRTTDAPTEIPVPDSPAWSRTDEIPETVVEKAKEQRYGLSLKQWQGLTDLQRFALLKLSNPGHENKNFPRAMKEFGFGIDNLLLDKIQARASEIYGDVVHLRRHLHTYPELSFKEHKTAEFVKQQLDALGIPWKAVAGTGVLATVTGSLPSESVVAVRADMDALPIQEANKVSYASRHANVMHACGHDFHTASLLGTARIIHGLKDAFGGTVKFFFQPGEEVLPGGATHMIRDGVLENPRVGAVIGQHAMPRIPAGKIGIRKGKHMASMDALSVRIIGRGGHGAQPHLNIDPVVIASHIVIALQQIVSRMAHPGDPTVLSFGKVIANGAVNVIPDEVYMEGTFRAMNETWRMEAHKRMTQMAEQIAEAMGATCEFRIERGYPFLVNEERLTEEVRAFAVDYLGEENVLDEDIWMAAEDFAYYSQAADACFYLCGVGNEERNITSSLHTPTFDIDEDALRVSTGLMAYIALKRLGN